MNPVINPRCGMIFGTGCTDADMLALWCMFQAAVLLLCTKSKLQLLAMAVKKLSCDCCHKLQHVAERVQRIMSLIDTDFDLRR